MRLENAPFYLMKHWIQCWLRRFLPAWSDFAVELSAPYLGCAFGPAALELFWSEAIAKWSERAAQIAASGASGAVISSLYRQRAASTLQYLAQLAPLPHFELRERDMISSMIRFPAVSLSLAGFFNLGDWGGIQFVSLRCSAAAALIRAARFTIRSWPEAWAMIQREFADENSNAPLASSVLGSFVAPPWTIAPIARTLARAYHGELEDPEETRCAKIALRDTLAEQKEAEDSGQRFKCQRTLTRKLQEQRFSDDLIPTFKRRLAKYHRMSSLC